MTSSYPLACSLLQSSNGYADALEWIIHASSVSHILHYLDDFLVLGPPGSGMCKAVLDNMLSTCQSLGDPLAMDRIEGPTTSLVFLGIKLDTDHMEARLPANKFRRLCLELQAWAAHKRCRRKELEQLLGHHIWAELSTPHVHAAAHGARPRLIHQAECRLLLRHHMVDSFHPPLEWHIISAAVWHC